MNNKRGIRVGIIAEDDSDVEAARILIRRISEKDNIGIKRFVGRGCGRIKRKCRTWVEILDQKGCKYLILIHDLDRNDLENLSAQIEKALEPCPIRTYLICIPIEEMEAWWLSDTNAIKLALNLNKFPTVKGNPQNIASPKEYIGKLVKKYSLGRKIYLNTKHNEIIAKNLDFKKANKCNSFRPFYNFIKNNI